MRTNRQYVDSHEAVKSRARCEEALWRTSAFVHVQDGRLCNDLTGRSRSYSSEELQLIIATMNTAIGVRALAEILPLPLSNVREMVAVLAKEMWVVESHKPEQQLFNVEFADIETCRQCNARCGFCPQSTEPKAPAIMPLDLYEHILHTLSPYRLKSVSLNHYGEPLLDPLFRQRCQQLGKFDIPLLLFTNGSLLTESMMKFLLEDFRPKAVVINLPSCQPKEWAAFMKLPERFHFRVTSAIYQFAAARIPVEIVVNGVTDCLASRRTDIKNAFGQYSSVRILDLKSNDRAGLQRDLVSLTPHRGANCLSGCDRITRYVHFAYDGRVHLCCQDYKQEIVLGDIREAGVAGILGGKIANQLRAQIYGMEPAPAQLLCRSCSQLRSSRVDLPAVKSETCRTE